MANQGIGQFIHLGCGMPTAPNTHETARAVNPGARVAYVDNDAVALSHLQEVVAKSSPGVTAVAGDVADADAILRAASAVLDLDPPGVVGARQWRAGWSDLPAPSFRTGQAICGVGRIG